MKKAEISDVILRLDKKHQAKAKLLAKELKKFLPQDVIIAIDCVPNKELNAFHYVSGKNEVVNMIELIKNTKREELDIARLKHYVKKANDFNIDFDAGSKIKLWKKLKFLTFDKVVNWEKSFTVHKPSGEMKIYSPSLERKRLKGEIKAQRIKLAGAVTHTEMLIFLHKPGANYYQLYLNPLPGPKEPNNNTTYRLLFNCSEDETNFIGGIWTSSKNLRLKNQSQIRRGLII